MMQRILSCLFIMVSVIIVSCNNNDDDKIKHFDALVDVSNMASITDDRYNAILVYSTDVGQTWSEFVPSKPGEAYTAKVIHKGADEEEINADGCYAFNWSESNPAPTGEATGGSANFVMQSNSTLKLTVNDYHAYDASKWTGVLYGIEDGDIRFTDENTFTQDPNNPNKFWMDNYWGIGNPAYIILSPSKDFATQEVSVPAQWTSEVDEYQILEGSGVYDQCRQTLDMTSVFVTDNDNVAGLDTIQFDYHFQRVKPKK